MPRVCSKFGFVISYTIAKVKISSAVNFYIFCNFARARPAKVMQDQDQDQKFKTFKF